jgi:TPR repeat protein
MSNELQVIDESALTVETRNALDQEIDQIIAQHKNNRTEINQLVFESIEAVTEADNAQAELSGKGFFSRLIGGFTGSNQHLQNQINSNLAVAQYAGQQTLQKLAEQNLMSFDLIAAVNNLLNASIQSTNQEFQNIYQGLRKFLRYNQNEMVRMEMRLEKVERNANLLTWENSIEYLDFQGKEYTKLNVSGKIVCLVRDFLNITKGNWSTSDLLLLKTAMATIGLEPRSNVNYWRTIQEINDTPALREKLLARASIKTITEPSYLLSLAVLKKLADLDDSDAQVVDNVFEFLANKGIQTERKILRDKLMLQYFNDCISVNLDREVACYDLVLDLLYNLQQGKEEHLLVLSAKGMELDLESAKTMYKKGQIEEAKALFEELAKEGYIPAMKQLGCLYQNANKFAEANQWYEKAGKSGSDWGWVCLGEAFLNGTGVKIDYEKALKYFQNAYNLNGDAQGVAACKIGLINQHFEKYDDSNIWFSRAGENGNEWGWYNLGNAYYNGVGIEQDYEKAKEFYQKAYDLNGEVKGNAALQISEIYLHQKEYEQANAWLRKAGENGNEWGWYNLGNAYHNGLGVEQDYEKAKEFYQKAYDLDDGAKGESANRIGEIYSKLGQYSEANTWYQEAGKIGCDSGWYNLGNAYHVGIGVKQNYVRASIYYEKAYDLNGELRGDAANMIGLEYKIKNKYNLANEWFTKSGEAGCEFGWYNLGEAYYAGIGVKQNYEISLVYYQKTYNLRKNGLGDLAHKIGDIYFKLKKYIPANIWYKKAGEAGCGWGWYELGNAYYKGIGVNEDIEKAIEYYKKGYEIRDSAAKSCAEKVMQFYGTQGNWSEHEKWSELFKAY